MRRILGAGLLLLSLSAAADLTPSKERVVLRTDLGDIVLVLYPKLAPKTVAQFLKLARLGVYDTTHFFRVHPSFVAQVSDQAGRAAPLSVTQHQAIQPIPGEFTHKVRHTFGKLSMARYDHDPNSGQMSFSILLGDAPHLDGRYAIFGEVEQGAELLQTLQRLPRKDVTPVERIEIRKAIVVDTPAQLARVLGDAPGDFRTLASIQPPSAWNTLLGGLVLIGVIAVFVALAGKRLSARTVAALHLANLLIVVFCAVVALARQTAESPWLGVLLICALLATFRLLSRFEAA